MTKKQNTFLGVDTPLEVGDIEIFLEEVFLEEFKQQYLDTVYTIFDVMPPVFASTYLRVSPEAASYLESVGEQVVFFFSGDWVDKPDSPRSDDHAWVWLRYSRKALMTDPLVKELVDNQKEKMKVRSPV